MTMVANHVFARNKTMAQGYYHAIISNEIDVLEPSQTT